MKIEVLLFASAREAAGTARLALDVPDGSTVRALFDALTERHAGLAPVLPRCRAAVDEVFASPSQPLAEGAVVAILPPVSGG